MDESPPDTAALRLLEQLAAGAGAEELSHRASRLQGAPDLEPALSLALRVAGSLHQHRRREAELAALFDTASDLAGKRDLDAVLRSIVHRARMLLGTDTAYLTLPDEEAGDTYVRVTDGAVSPLFQSLRVPLGTGLGGLVAQSGRPYASADYRSDQRFQHSGTIDAGVGDEGLAAILGVPLMLGSRTRTGSKVIGVLFAADRTPRTFTADEVALLCSMATYAAIAIDTARVMDDTRAALAELEQANATIRAHVADVQRAERAHDRLTDLILRGGTMDDVARAAAELLEGGIRVYDAAGHVLAAAGDPPVLPPLIVSQAAEESRWAGRAIAVGDRWACAVLAGPELLGSLFLNGRTGLRDPERRLFERASVVCALLMLLRRSVSETENRIRGELITDLLLAPERDPSALIERGRNLGADLARAHLVLVADAPSTVRSRLVAAGRTFLFGTSGICAEHDGRLTLFRPTGASDHGEPGTVAREAAAQLSHSLGVAVTVAAAGPARGPLELAASHAEAARCLRALHVLGREGDGGCASDLGFLGVLLGRAHDVEGFVRTTLGPLQAWDESRGTDLVGTLDAYFASGSNLSHAKDRLHIHVNTLSQRLERVEKLLGAHWSSPDKALELQLAIRLRNLTSPQSATGVLEGSRATAHKHP